MIQPSAHILSIRRAFSLIEVLLAVFILAIGLIMVASVFPVGADWTRQATEDSVSQSIALNALSIIRNDYAPNSLNTATAGKFSGITTTTLQPLPSFTSIPISERTYQYGNASPFPANNPLACNYYWTALARVSPSQTTATASKSYDLYIFVFRKGDASQTFYAQPPTVTVGFNPDPGYTEITGDRDNTDLITTYPMGYHFQEPTLVVGSYVPGTYVPASNSFQPLPAPQPVPPVGFTAVGATSGTVFRQAVDFVNNTAISRPGLVGTPPTENIIFAPSADGTTASPLIYVYQTTVSF